jgi:hypothetical protein
MRRRLTLAAALCVLIATAAADVAMGTFPGQNGKIVYTRESFSQGSLRICTIDPNGTNKLCPPGTPTCDNELFAVQGVFVP